MSTYTLLLLIIIIGGIVGMIAYSFKKATVIHDYLDPEHIDDVYIFRDFHGYDIMKDDNHVKLFTFLEAKEFAKENPSYHVKLNNFDSEWEVAETYFNI